MSDKRAIMADIRNTFGNVGVINVTQICSYFNKSPQSAFIRDFIGNMTFHKCGREKCFLVMDVAEEIIKLGRN